MKRPKLIKDRLAHRDAMLEELYMSELGRLISGGRMPERAMRVIEERAAVARERVRTRKAGGQA